MPRAYNYTHNITINYKETGAANLGKNLRSVSVEQSKVVKSTNTMNQNMAKSTKSTGDAITQFRSYSRETGATAVAQDKLTDSTNKATQGQSRWGQSLRQNRGLLFGGTGLSSSIVEAAGMYGIYTDALTRKNEAQEEVNRLEEEGLQGTKDYTDAQQELQQQTRAFTMFQRNMALSMFDTVTFVTMLASSLLPRMGGATAKVTTAFKSLFGVMKGGQAVQLAQGIMPLSNAMGTLPAKVDKTTGALGRLKGAMVGLGLSNPFFIAITAIGAVLTAVALNVGGLRDKFNELGVEIGKTHGFLKPLLDALGTFGEFLGGMAGQNNIANATDQYGHLTKEAEAFRAMVIQTDRALTTMFTNLSRQQISQMFSEMRQGIENTLNKIKFTENPLRKWVEDLTGTINPELEKGLQEMVALWELYGDDIMGAKMTSKEGKEAQENVKKAFREMVLKGAEGIEETLPKFEEAVRAFFDIVDKEKLDSKELTPSFLTPEEVYQNFNKIVDVTEEGAKRVNSVIQTYLRVRRESGKEFAQQELDNIIAAGGVTEEAEINFIKRALNLHEQKQDDILAKTEEGKKELQQFIDKAEEEALNKEIQKWEDTMKAVEDGKTKINEFLEEEDQKEMQRKLKRHEDEIAFEEEKQKRLIDIASKNAQKLLDIQEKADREREEMRAGFDLLTENGQDFITITKLTKQYNDEVKELTESGNLLGQSNQFIEKTAREIILRYPELVNEGLTLEKVITDITASTDKSVESVKTFSEVWADSFKEASDTASQAVDEFKSAVEEAFTNKEGEFRVKKKDVKKNLLEAFGLEKGEAVEFTVPAAIDFIFSTPDIEDNMASLKTLITTPFAKISEDIAKDLLEEMEKALNALGIKDDSENPVMKAIQSLIDDIDEDGEMTSETLKTKLAAIYKAATGEDITEEGENPISDNVNKMVEDVNIDESVKSKVEAPFTTAFTNITTEAESMESDIAFSFEFISGDADTTSTEIETSFINAFTNVINEGQELEGRLEDNFDTIWSSVDDLISKVEDLTEALEDIPNITRTVTIKKKIETVGGGGSGALFTGGGFDFREGGIIGGMQHGGIIDQAQIYRGVRIGEHNKPEAVIPLSNPNNLADKALNIQAPINFHFTLEGNKVLREADIWKVIRPNMGQYQSNYG